MTMTDNPRETIGANFPPLARSIAAEEGDFALVTTAFLEEEYASRPQIVASLLEEARALPATIDGEEAKGKYVSLIKRLRDEVKVLVGLHSKEKTPYLRGGQAVDQFFFGLIDRLARRDKRNKPGGADVLLERLNAYDLRLLAEEQAKRDREAQEAARKEREARTELDRLAAQAEQDRIAAARARAPARMEEKSAVAAASEQAASTAAAEAVVATARAEDTHIATLAKPADIMRTRGSDGTLSTMATEPYAEIVDESKLDRDKLWAFIKLEHKEMALRSWAKNTGHTVQMEGAKIGKRPKSVVR